MQYLIGDNSYYSCHTDAKSSYAAKIIIYIYNTNEPSQIYSSYCS